VYNLISLYGGKILVSAGGDIRIWNLGELKQLYVEQCRNLQTIKLKGSLETLRLSTNPQVSTVELETNFFPQLEFTNCDKLNLKETLKPIMDGSLKSERKDIFPFLMHPSHTGWVSKLISLNGGKILASASCDKTIRIWDVASGKELKKFAGHKEPVFTLISL